MSETREFEREYDNERKSQFLWFSDVTPNSEIHKLIKNCSTDDLMHIFDLGYRYALIKTEQKIQDLDNISSFKSFNELKNDLINDINQKIDISFTSNINGHTDKSKSSIRMQEFNNIYRKTRE